MTRGADSPRTQVIPAQEARQRLGRILEQARYHHQRFVVERAGKPMAVVVGIQEWENILETLAELDDPEYLQSVREARDDIARGEGLTLDALRQELAQANDGR